MSWPHCGEGAALKAAGEGAIPPPARMQWCADVGSPDGDTEANRLLDAVFARYAGADRHYHGTRHVLEVVARIDVLADRLVADAPAHDIGLDRSVIRLAAWYHDAVYDPRSSTNEADSATLASEALTGLGVPAPAIAAVERLVMVTKTHLPDRIDEALLIDASSNRWGRRWAITAAGRGVGDR